MDVKSVGHFLINVPLYGVPAALVLWAAYIAVVRKAPLDALIGLLIGAVLCGAAFVLFIASVYCEHCAGDRVRARDLVPAFVYFSFGITMLVAMVWTARKPKPKSLDATSVGDGTQ